MGELTGGICNNNHYFRKHFGYTATDLIKHHTAMTISVDNHVSNINPCLSQSVWNS